MTEDEIFCMFAKFLLGRLSVRDDVRVALQRTPLDLIARHAVCDFGIASSRRVKQNLLALEEGSEIRSEYLIDPTDPTKGSVSVVTTAGWGETKVTLVKTQPKRKKSDGLPF